MQLSGQFHAQIVLTPPPPLSEETATGTRWVGDWVASRVVLGAVKNRQIFRHSRESNPARRFTDSKEI
jgi:hypothetical protein